MPNATDCYQVDWAVAASGKRVAATKRRVRFRFGFSNSSALAKGMAGNEARGEEHEVNLTWSLTSGKRVVLLDGKEVHFSMGRRGDAKFETSWPMKGGHILKLVAHASPPLRATPEFRQFDLQLDGMSFFSMPQIFELGVHGGRVRSLGRAVEPYAHDRGFASNNSYPAPPNQHASQAFSGPARRSTLSVEAPPAPVVVKPIDVLSEPTKNTGTLDHLMPPSPVVVDQFTPVQARPHIPTFQDVSNQILSTYGPPPSVSAPPAPTSTSMVLANHQPHSNYAPTSMVLANNQPHTHYAPQVQTQQQQQPVPYTQQQYQMHPSQPPPMVTPDAASAASNGGFYSAAQVPAAPLPTHPAPLVTQTMMKPLDLDELRDSPPPVDAMDRAVQNLVNLDDLKETKTTPEQIKAKKEKEAKAMKQNKSRPKGPVATDWHVGTNASLADIQQHKKPVAPPTKEVMKVHAFDPAAAQAGMLVVYGQPSPQAAGYGGSIPANTGFGAGRMPMYPNHGHNQYVRSAY